MSFRITRRQFLIVGAGTGGALFLAACGSSKTGSAINKLLQDAAPGTPFEPLGEMRSSNGLLEVSLVAAGGMVPWGDTNRYALAYNGVVPATTLRVRPGDVLRVNFTNGLSEATNLHTHGLHVSPNGNSDNPFTMIERGGSFAYEFQIPEDHPSGTLWYHPPITATPRHNSSPVLPERSSSKMRSMISPSRRQRTSGSSCSPFLWSATEPPSWTRRQRRSSKGVRAMSCSSMVSFNRCSARRPGRSSTGAS